MSSNAMIVNVTTKATPERALRVSSFQFPVSSFTLRLSFPAVDHHGL
jgi:hypothetical protein